jgi:uroporphyrinogen decarboxylase
MTNRENIMAACRRQKPEHIPFGLTFCASLYEEFKKRTGCTDYAAYYGLDYRFMYMDGSANPVDYSSYYKELPRGTWIDEWGVAHIPGSVAHFSRRLHPMENFTSPKQIWEFPTPDITADYRYERLKKRVAEVHSEGNAAIFFAIQLFEPAWYLRGLDNFLCDMINDEDMAEAAMEKMTSLMEQACAKIAATGVDMVVYGDDVGTQRGLMMSLNLWQKWVKPYTKRVIDAAKSVNPDLLAYYHSDGAIMEIIPELIEIGVDVLNPVQPECMNPKEVKAMYGDKLAFWGTIGTQTTMPFGTPQEVRQAVIESIETVGYDGGLVIAPTHVLEPEVPWENVTAFVDTVKNYKV